MAILYTDALDKKHSAHLFSKASCITIVLVTMAAILPLLLVVRTHNFWITDNFHYEQPEVTHLNEFLVVIQTQTETLKASTNEDLNMVLQGTQGRAGSIDIVHVDDNQDGRPEAINVNLQLAGLDASLIRTVVILQTVSYGIRDIVDADIKMPIFNIFQTPYGFSKLKVEGELNLQQSEPYTRGAIKRQIGFEDIHVAQ